MILPNDIGYLQIPASLDLKPDDVLFIGADLSRLAMVCAKEGHRFEVNRFIDAFLDQLPDGTLVIPTYTDDFHDGMTFDVRKSKPNIGALAVAAFKRKEAYRTLDPFHSVAVWGKHVPQFAAITDHHTFGKHAAFGLLHQLNAKMLMIDVTMNQNFTFVHYCEEQADVSWRRLKRHRINVVDHQGVSAVGDYWFFTRKKGYVNALDPLEKLFKDEQLLTEYRFRAISLNIICFSVAYSGILQDIVKNKGKKIHKFSGYEWFRVIGKKLLNINNKN